MARIALLWQTLAVVGILVYRVQVPPNPFSMALEQENLIRHSNVSSNRLRKLPLLLTLFS